MKKLFILSFIFLFIASSQLDAKRLNAFISYCSFYSPQDGPFVETYISVLGSSAYFMPIDNGAYQAKLEILILFKQNDTIKAFKKYNLLSPELSDSAKNDIVFHDQQRISLENGQYDMEISIRDVNSKFAAYVIVEPILISYEEGDVQVSGIELVESYTVTEEENAISKSGFDLIPLPFNYYPPSVDKLFFYAEIYNTLNKYGKDGKYLLRIYIEEMQTSRKVTSLIYQKRKDAKTVEPILHEFDISNLHTGDYFLVIEVKDKTNALIAMNKLYFARLNDKEINVELADDASVEASFVSYMKNRDTLAEFIRSLRPISTPAEKTFADKNLKTSNLLTFQKFFLNFWIQRDPLNPELAWSRYAIEVKKVNNNYGTRIRKGYESDRGRVYLKYGPPNSISEAPHEPNAYPYEIWHYYTLMNQSNRKFVFYNPDLVTNDYELLHSDALGEYSDYNWKMRLQNRNFTTNDLDEQNPNFGWGSKVDDYFNSPR